MLRSSRRVGVSSGSPVGIQKCYPVTTYHAKYHTGKLLLWLCVVVVCLWLCVCGLCVCDCVCVCMFVAVLVVVVETVCLRVCL